MGKYVFQGWSDEYVENPKKSGEYLCLIQYHNTDEYIYGVVSYDKKEDQWEVSNSVEHILWCNLPPSPFN